MAPPHCSSPQTNVSSLNVIQSNHTATLAQHSKRIKDLEGQSEDVFVSTQLLASTANETTGVTNRIRAEVRPRGAAVVSMPHMPSYSILSVPCTRGPP